MSATKRRRGRPETPHADLGPHQRLLNGSVVLGYRTDPERPSAPSIRAARAYVAYEHMGLSDAQVSAANRIRDAVEAVTGAREFNGGGLGGRAFWQVGGPTAVMVQAAADLRAVATVLGRAHERAVLLLVVDGACEDRAVVAGALEVMAAYWDA